MPGLADHVKKVKHQITIKRYAPATVFNYPRGIAQIILHFGKSPLFLHPDEINAHLFNLKNNTNLSAAYFKHGVLRTALSFKVYDFENRIIKLPGIKSSRKLPSIFSFKELNLVKAACNQPKWKKLTISWMALAAQKLDFNPLKCTHCKAI